MAEEKSFDNPLRSHQYFQNRDNMLASILAYIEEHGGYPEEDIASMERRDLWQRFFQGAKEYVMVPSTEELGVEPKAFWRLDTSAVDEVLTDDELLAGNLERLRMVAPVMDAPGRATRDRVAMLTRKLEGVRDERARLLDEMERELDGAMERDPVAAHATAELSGLETEIEDVTSRATPRKDKLARWCEGAGAGIPGARAFVIAARDLAIIDPTTKRADGLALGRTREALRRLEQGIRRSAPDYRSMALVLADRLRDDLADISHANTRAAYMQETIDECAWVHARELDSSERTQRIADLTCSEDALTREIEYLETRRAQQAKHRGTDGLTGSWLDEDMSRMDDAATRWAMSHSSASTSLDGWDDEPSDLDEPDPWHQDETRESNRTQRLF